MDTINSIVNFQLPPRLVFGIPSVSKTPLPPYPLNDPSPLFKELFRITLHPAFVVCFALTYFLSVHYINDYVIIPRQKKALGVLTEKDPKLLKKLPLVPFKIAKTALFRRFVLLHNMALCIYSVYTFVGITSTINQISHSLYDIFFYNTQNTTKTALFWQSICNLETGLWAPKPIATTKGLSFYSYWFYISKFYEIIDTIIILLKGKPSSLLQSYHHAGAMLSMWSGVRFVSPPIWVFVVFNSFIHSIMYFYYTLSCLHIRVPVIFKQTLTTLQICQFVFGGSLALAHMFVLYYDHLTGSFKNCIANPSHLLLIFINVLYLTPLTMLFGAFWIESYVKKSKPKSL